MSESPGSALTTPKAGRRRLLLLLLLAVLALLVLLPASPLTLRWVWTQLQDGAEQQGFTLDAASLRGNLWTGLALQDVTVQNDAANIELSSLKVGYSIVGLLQGQLALDISLTGVRGDVQVQDLLAGFSADSAGTPGLPFAITIGNLAVNDVQLALSDAPEELKLPDLTFNSFRAGMHEDGFSFDTTVSTVEGEATVHGTYSLQHAQLLLEIQQADIAIVRYWWDGIVAGTATGSVQIGADGVTADAVIHDASIHFLDATVNGINGTGQLRDLQIHAQVQGDALGGVINASAHVDLDAQHFTGEALGAPQLASIVPWLGQLLNLDTNSISGDGQLQTQATVSGWQDVIVNGSAWGSGLLAGRPLTINSGAYAFTTQQGFSLNLDSNWSGGNINVELQPLSYSSESSGLAHANSSQLTIQAHDLAVASDSELQLSAHGELTFGAAAGNTGNLVTARMYGPVADRQINLELAATPSAGDLLDWQAMIQGSDGLGSDLSGSLNLMAGLVSGELAVNYLALTGPADSGGVTAQLNVPPTPLGTSLPLELLASWGPLELTALPLQLDLATNANNLELTSPATSLDLKLPRGGGAQLALAGLPLQLAGVPAAITGTVLLPAHGQLQLDLLAQAFGLSAHAWSETGTDVPLLHATLTGAAQEADAISASWNPATGIWQAAGRLPLAELAQHWNLPLTGSLTGAAGNTSGVAAGSFSGQLGSSGLTAEVQVQLDGNQVTAQASSDLLGETWQVTADLLPLPVVSASSNWGELQFADGVIHGSGTIGGTTEVPGIPWELQSAQATDWLDGLQLTIGGDLQLTASVSSDAAGLLSVQAAAPGLEAFWSDGRLDLEASAFNAAGLFPANLTGGLTQLPVSGRVHGPAERLQLQLEIVQESFQLQAGGTISAGSELDIELHGGAMDGFATLAGQLSGTLAQPGLQASVTLQELLTEQIRIPAFTAELLLADGMLQLHSSSVTPGADVLRFQHGQLSGVLNVPVTLLDVPHTLELRAAGSADNPGVQLQLLGELLTGSARLPGSQPADQAGEDQVQLEMMLHPLGLPEHLLESLGPFVPHEPVSIRGSIKPDGNWQAHASTALDLPLLPLSLGAQAQGHLLDYSGTVNLRAAASQERLLTASLTGSGASLSIHSDLQSLAASELLAELQLDAQLEAAGTIMFTSGPVAAAAAQSTGLTVDAALRGTVLGVAVDLQANSSSTAPLLITGLIAGEPLDLQVVLGAGTSAPLLLGSWADASFSVTQQTEGEGTLLQGEFDTASDAAGGTITLLLDAVALELQQLQLHAGALTLQAAGQLLPAAQVTGALRLADEALAELHVKEDAAGKLHASLRTGDLELLARFDQELQLQLQGNLHLTESALSFVSLPVEFEQAAQSLHLVSDLSWTQTSGFKGSMTLDGPLTDGIAPLLLHVTATGEETLDLHGAVTTPGNLADWQEALLDVSLQVPADPLSNRTLAGSVKLAASLQDLLPGYTGRPLVLSGSLAVTGNLSNPEIQGPLALSGLLAAAGSLQLRGYAASGSLQLAGEQFALDGQLQQRAWDAQLTVQQQPLSGFFPWLTDAKLSTSIESHGAIGQRTQAIVKDFSVSARNSLLEASGTLGSDVQGIMNLDVDLADTNAGLPLAGRLRGTLTYGSTGLQRLLTGVVRGSLQLQDVVLYNGLPAMNGSAELLGSAQDPELRVSLTAEGGGQLQLDARPARNTFKLSSSVAAAGMTTDFLISGDTAGLTATGGLTLPGGAFQFVRPDGAGIELAGSGAFERWRARLDPEAKRVQLTAFLQSALPSLHGQLELDTGLAGSGLYLHGQLYGLKIAGLEVGDVTLSAANLLDGWMDISGDQLSGRVNPLADLAWELYSVELKLLETLSLVASGAGHGINAAVDLILTGTLAGESLNVPARISTTPAEVIVTSLGSVRNGQIELNARLADENWQGDLRLSDIQLASGIKLDATGQLQGSRLSPQLQLQTSSSLNELTATGNVRLALTDLKLSELQLQQSLGGAPLHEPLELSGTVWPALQLQLSGASSGTLTVSSVPDGSSEFSDWPLTAKGELQLPFEPLLLHLSAAGETESTSAVNLQLEVPALPGLQVAGSVDVSSLKALIQQLEQGVTMQGRNLTRGEARLKLLKGELTLTDFGAQLEAVDLQMTGSVNLSGQGQLEGLLQLNDAPGSLTWLAGNPQVPFTVVASGSQVRLHSLSQLGDLTATVQLPSGRTDVTASLTTSGGDTNLNLQFTPLSGPQGRITLSGVELFSEGQGNRARLDGTIGVNEQRMSADLRFTLGDGAMLLEGNWGLADLLPGWLAPRGATGGSASARVRELPLASIPFLHERLPYLAGTLSTDLVATNDSISGSITIPDLAAAGGALPFSAAFSGPLAQPELNGLLGESPLSLKLVAGQLDGLLELRRFPLHLLAQLLAGPLDVTAEMTGVTRFTVPLARPGESELRIATELVRLERDGITTTGNLALDLSNGLLEISDAVFDGAGHWEASGVLKADELDFELLATDADFGPLLGLLPVLAQLNAGANGSLQITAEGTLARPRISIDSENLDFELAGISYQLNDLNLLLADQDLSVTAQLLATDPLAASLQLGGGSKLNLSPLQFSDAAFTFAGSALVPVVGPVQQLEGTIRSAGSEPGAALLLDTSGMLGAPFKLTGSLLPLDLHLQGDDLLVSMPALYLVDTQLDVDLRLAHTDATRVSGSIFVDQTRIQLQDNSDPTVTTAERGALELGTGLLFDGISVSAPQRIRFNESFGTAELAAQLSLSGSLASPLLNGYVQALRGTLQFSGRDFEVRNAVALFDANSGLYPLLDFTAVTTFEKNRTLPPGSSYEFSAPRDRNRIEVKLSFQGELDSDPDSSTGFRLSVQPLLSSDARVQETRIDGLTSGPRELTENELLSLITLGRVEFGGSNSSAGGLATAVAEGALGTALDMLVLSELQRALGDALGLDVVEIRSSAVSSLLSGGNGDAFSVSLRLGGYLSEEVFASYRIGAFDDPRGLYALTNEVLLTYDLGPLELDLAGRVNFTDAPGLDPNTELSVGLRYAFSDFASLETGIDLSNERQQLRFGVTLRW